MVFVGAILVAVGVVYRYYPEAPQQPTGDTGAPVPTVPQIDPASIGKIVVDKETGKEFLSNQIIVEFALEVTEEEALAIIAKHEGTMVAHFTKVPVYLIQVKDGGDGSGAKQALPLFQSEARVKKAELNFLTVAAPPATTP